LLDHPLVPELNREDVQRRMERARIYEETAQPRSHLLKERLLWRLLTVPSTLHEVLEPGH
jgi:hypothetical protein